MVSAAVFSLRGHIPGPSHNPFADAIGGVVALVIVIAIIGAALLLLIRPLDAHVGTRRPVAGSAVDAGANPVAHAPATARPRTRSFAIVGCTLALFAEFVALCRPDRPGVHAVAGVVIGLVLLSMRGYLGVIDDPPANESVPDDGGRSLQHWASRTESLIGWSQTTRADWDRHIRPVLARQFEMATKANQRRTTDPASFRATGMMLFGADLWQWVDPDNVARRGAARRGPGRRTLEEIIERLEQV